MARVKKATDAGTNSFKDHDFSVALTEVLQTIC